MKPRPRYRPGDFIPGTSFEIYDVKQGGMGVVYLCQGRDKLRIPMAVKTIRDEYLTDESARERIKREVALWMEVRGHPYILECWWAEFIKAQLFLFLSLVEGVPGLGVDLRAWITHRCLTPPKSINFITAVCRGLQYAHEQVGLVHRDLKPENILISKQGVVQITDFGLATSLRSDKLVPEQLGVDELSTELGTLTKSGSIIGTPPYMSPEQWRGNALDFRSDIYALGCIFFEMLTGQLVFPGRTASDFKNYHLSKEPPPLRTVNPNLPTALEQIVSRCLQKDIEARYQDYTTLIADLDQAFEAIEGRTPPPMLSEFEELDPELVKMSYEFHMRTKASTLRQIGRYQKALNICEQLIGSSKTPATGGLWHEKAACLVALGRYAEAEKSFQRAIELTPKDETLLGDFAEFFCELEDFGKALSWNEQALRLNPEDTGNWSRKGFILYELGKVEEAVACWKHVLSLDDTSEKVWHNLGVLLTELGEFEKAVAHFNKAVELAPAFTQAWHVKGKAHRHLRQLQEALACFDRTLQLDPILAKAYLDRSVVYIDLQRYDEAGVDFRRAIELDPTLMQAHFGIGAELGNRGRQQEALPDSEKAAQFRDQQRKTPPAVPGEPQLGVESIPSQSNLAQRAVVAFMNAPSLEDMRPVAAAFPSLADADFIAAVEQIVTQQAPPERLPAIKQRLAWLRQIADEQKREERNR